MMEWLAIASLIIKIFEAVAPMIEECLNDRLERAAEHLPPPDTFGSEGAAAAALIDKAISMARGRPLVRMALRQMKATAIVNGAIRTTPLTSEEIKEAHGIVGIILAD